MTMIYSNRQVSTLWLGVLLLLMLMPPACYFWVLWFNTSNTPVSDDYIGGLFPLLRFIQAQNAIEKIEAFTWYYNQHRLILPKIVYLVMYWLTGKEDFHIHVIIGNLSLLGILYFFARNLIQHRLPLYGIPLFSLMIFSFYFWPVSVWSGASIAYYGTIMLAFASFFWLDRPRPVLLPAILSSWLATYTFANGVLCLPIASMIVIYNYRLDKRYTKFQLSFWFVSTALCLITHLSTISLFSSELYGAKTLEQSFVNVSGRMVDFLESVGAAPFFPGENREGKIALGAIVLLASVSLLTTKKILVSPAILGLGVFSLATLFVVSLFRYSAGGNPGYQVFTVINLAVMFVLASSIIPARRWPVIPALMLLCAVAFNVRALTENMEKIRAHQAEQDQLMKAALVNADFRTIEALQGMLYDALDNDLYTPLEDHQTLNPAGKITAMPSCKVSPQAVHGVVSTQTSASSYALAVDVDVPVQNIGQQNFLLLCGANSSFRVEIPQKNIRTVGSGTVHISLLIDKRKLPAAVYSVHLDNGASVVVFDKSVEVPVITEGRINRHACKSLNWQFKSPSFFPVLDYYCKKNKDRVPPRQPDSQGSFSQL